MLQTRLATIITSLAIAAVVHVTPAAAANASMLLPGDPKAMNLLSAEQALLDLTNADRAANGVAPLQLDPDTLVIARDRAESQLQVPTLSHYDADGQLVFTRMFSDASIGYQFAGENLARSSLDDVTVTQRVEQALMASPLHRKNILEPGFKRLAIGAATDSTGQVTFAELYRD